MLSPRTALAARFYIFVFSQLISSTAGNFADFKTNFKSYHFAVIVNYFSRYKLKFFITRNFHSFVLIQLIIYMESKEGCFPRLRNTRNTRFTTVLNILLIGPELHQMSVVC